MEWSKKFEENAQPVLFELMILHTLQERDMSSNEILQTIHERTTGLFCIPKDSFYGPLYRLLIRGFVTGYIVEEDENEPLRQFHISEAGREYLASGRKHWEKVRDGLDGFFQWQPPAEKE